MGWGEQYNKKIELSSRVEEFANPCHNANNGQFCELHGGWHRKYPNQDTVETQEMRDYGIALDKRMRQESVIEAFPEVRKAVQDLNRRDKHIEKIANGNTKTFIAYVGGTIDKYKEARDLVRTKADERLAKGKPGNFSEKGWNRKQAEIKQGADELISQMDDAIKLLTTHVNASHPAKSQSVEDKAVVIQKAVDAKIDRKVSHGESREEIEKRLTALPPIHENRPTPKTGQTGSRVLDVGDAGTKAAKTSVAKKNTRVLDVGKAMDKAPVTPALSKPKGRSLDFQSETDTWREDQMSQELKDQMNDKVLTALVEEFYNQNHQQSGANGGRFISGPSEGGGGDSSGSSDAGKPSPANVKHARVAQAHLIDARKIVGADTKEGIVIGQTHRALSLFSLGKAFAKGEAISDKIKKKFEAADSWLKTDPTPENKSLVHRLLQKAKAAISYMTGGDLRKFAYMNAAGNLLGLAAHLGGTAGAGGAAEGSKWPPPGWGFKESAGAWHHIREHVHSEIVKKISEIGEHHGGKKH